MWKVDDTAVKAEGLRERQVYGVFRHDSKPKLEWGQFMLFDTTLSPYSS